MAVTGTNTFTVTRNDIIDASLRTLGIVGIGETPQTEDYTNCSQALNIMIKSWAKKGWPLWTVSILTIPMVSGVRVYPIGATAGYIYSVTITNGGTGYPASGTVSFSTGAATGTYTSTGGVIDAITITAGGNSYTTLPTVSFSGAGTGATGTAVKVGLTTNKPVRAFSAYIRDADDNDTTLLEMSKEEYDGQGDKFNSGVPNQFYFDNQLSNANLYVFNVPDDSTRSVYLSVARMYNDMTSGTDSFDFPQECFQAIKWGLCAEIAVEYGVDIQLVPYYEQKAITYIQEVFDFSVEESSVFFTADVR